MSAGKREEVDFKMAFFMATSGGAQALALEARIGTIDEGKEFDALVMGEAGNYDDYGFVADGASPLLRKFEKLFTLVGVCFLLVCVLIELSAN